MTVRDSANHVWHLALDAWPCGVRLTELSPEALLAWASLLRLYDRLALELECHAELERIRNTCTIMARIMTWVWMEAEFQHSRYLTRSEILREAIDRRMFRLT